MPAEWSGRPVLVRWQLERQMYDFKNSFPPNFICIHRAKYIISRDMFCLIISEQKFIVWLCESCLIMLQNITMLNFNWRQQECSKFNINWIKMDWSTRFMCLKLQIWCKFWCPPTSKEKIFKEISSIIM